MKLNRRQLRRLIQESLQESEFPGGLIKLTDDAAMNAIEELLLLQSFPQFILDADQVELKNEENDGKIEGVFLELVDSINRSDDQINAQTALQSIFTANNNNDGKAFEILGPFLDLDGDNKGKSVRKSSSRTGGIGFTVG